MKGWKKMFNANRNQKQSWVAIPTLGKVDLKLKTVTGVSKCHYSRTKGGKCIKMMNSCTYSYTLAKELKYKAQIITDLKGETDSNTIVGEFNTPLSATARSFRLKINKKTWN